ncbi:MAG: LemA family protein [Acidimicrobiia bacterium]|nr:MAG: LemA family protein [Acidimicrobiia bacterium]
MVYTPPMGWIIAIIVVFVVGLLLVQAYNKLIKRRNRVDTAWSHVDVQLQRRLDLIPNLVETVKGYASHERETFERVTEARGASNSASTPAEQAQADNFLTSALRQLFAVAEDYPELRASENFQNLQGELSDTEDKIAISRQIYNDTVLSYNNTVQQIPTNMVAAIAGFDAREFYDANPDAQEAPTVEF